MFATNFFETAILNTMRGITLSAPLQMWCALYLNNPTETGAAGVEVNYSGYERKLITFTEPAEEGSSITIKNDTQITYATSPVSAGTITYLALLDSKVSGNMYTYGKLTEDLTISEGEAPVLLPQEVSYFFSANLSKSFKRKVLNVIRGQNILGFSPYFALFNGNPDIGGAELAGTNYARVPLTFSTPSEQESGQMLMSNSAAVNFNRPTTSWGNWGYSSIYSAVKDGEPIWVQERTPTKEIKKGYMPTIAENAVKVMIN